MLPVIWEEWRNRVWIQRRDQKYSAVQLHLVGLGSSNGLEFDALVGLIRICGTVVSPDRGSGSVACGLQVPCSPCHYKNKYQQQSVTAINQITSPEEMKLYVLANLWLVRQEKNLTKQSTSERGSLRCPLFQNCSISSLCYAFTAYSDTNSRSMKGNECKGSSTYRMIHNWRTVLCKISSLCCTWGRKSVYVDWCMRPERAADWAKWLPTERTRATAQSSQGYHCPRPVVSIHQPRFIRCYRRDTVMLIPDQEEKLIAGTRNLIWAWSKAQQRSHRKPRSHEGSSPVSLSFSKNSQPERGTGWSASENHARVTESRQEPNSPTDGRRNLQICEYEI